jgi:hypothetical protein
MASVDPHRELMSLAITRDAEAQHALLSADPVAARSGFAAAAEAYRASWEVAPPGSYGRLIGMLKSAVLAGGGEPEAEYARAALGELSGASPPAAYAAALAALLTGDDDTARAGAALMAEGSEVFQRTAAAIAALADGDAVGFAGALREIVLDFEQRTEHLTGVAVADTALMLAELARRRGIATAIDSPLFPPARRG